jgi:hypothetical protein
MSQKTLLIDVASLLDGFGIAYMLTGSHASSLQGEPRSTHDIDLVVALEPYLLPRLLAAFPAPRFYVSETAAHEAVRHRRTFNVLEPATGNKIDFFVLKDTPFDRERFGRRIRVELSGVPISVSSPEDTILQKLRWCSELGGSEKHLLDAIGVYEMQADRLDLTYIHRWVCELALDREWRAILEPAEPFDENADA